MPTETATKYEMVSPFPEEHLPIMWKWVNEFAPQMMDDFSPQNYEQLVEKSKQDAQNGGKSYAVMENGEPIGCVWGEHVGDNVYAGHLVFERDSLTSAKKLEAASQAVKMFFTDGARKIRWMALADNRAYRIFLRKLGATLEGELKKETRRNGQPCDVVLMASFPSEV